MNAPRLILALLAATLLGCPTGASDTTSAAPPDCAFAAAPDGAESLLHVWSGGHDGDGSRHSPYRTLDEALEAATAGDTVLIAAGDYAEGIVIGTPGVTLIGNAGGCEGDGATRLLPPDGAPGLLVSGAGGVVVRDLQLHGPDLAGVSVAGGGSALLVGVHITDVADTSASGVGHGFQAIDQGSLVLEDCSVTGAEGTGILYQNATGSVLSSSVTGAALGGVRVESATDTVTLEDSVICDNAVVGVGVFSSHAIILQNDVCGTVPGPGGGDGVVVAGALGADGESLGPASVELTDNTSISDHARVGVLVADGSAATLTANTIEANPRGGVWLQTGNADEPVEIADNVIGGNGHAGIGVSGGARAIILQNLVSDTAESVIPDGFDAKVVGDGVGVFDGSAAVVDGNTVERSARHGIIISAADGGESSVVDNTVGDNGVLGIILQNLPGPEPDVSGNILAGNGDPEGDVVGVEADVVWDVVAMPLEL